MAVTMACMVAAGASAADPVGTPTSRRAMEGCEQARARADDGAFDAAVILAERAVREADDDPLAHFALFCSLGERLRQRGVSPRSILELRRLRAEVDRTIELAPTFPDALVGKANLLLDAPWFLGGDVPEAERLLRRALAIDPGYLGARRDLARTLARQDDLVGARTEARRALHDARAQGDADDVQAAAELLATFGD